jgi:hypothetical protein
VDISNTGNAAAGEGMTVTGPISATGTGTDNVAIHSGSPLTIASNVTSAGAIALAAAPDSPPFDNLTVDSGVTIQSTGSSVSLSAGKNINVPSGSTIEASTTITITGGATSANVVVEGTLTASSAMIGVASANNNNNNTFTITPSAATPITVIGGTATGTNTLNFNADGLAVTIHGNTITAAGDQPVTFSDFKNVNIINPAGGGSITLDAAAGMSDTMVLTGTGPGAGTYTLNGGTPISFSGVTSFTYNGGNMNEAITVSPYGTPLQQWGVATTINGGTGTATLTYNDVAGLSNTITNQPSGTQAGQLTDINAGTNLSIAALTYTQINNLTVNGSSGPGANDSLTVNGTTGADAVTIAPTTANNATITGAGPTITATGMGQIAYNGLGGNDSLTVTSPAATTVTLTPGAAVDSGTVQMGTAATLVPLSYSNLGTTGTLTVANTGGTRVDTLVYNGTAANDAFTVDAKSAGGPGEVLLNNQIDVVTPGVSTLTLSGLAGADTYSIRAGALGALPYTTINVNGSGGSALTLSGATGLVTVNLADNTPGSANPNTTITGYGGTVTLIGVATANLNTNGNALLVNGTSLNDNTTYTPTGASAGTFTNAGLATVFNFAGDTSTFTISGQGGTANQVTVDAPAGRVGVSEAARVVTVTPFGSSALEPVTLAQDVQIVNLMGGVGQDTFHITPAAGIQYASDGNLDNLVVNAIGSAVGASNTLDIDDTNTSDGIVIQGSNVPAAGTITVYSSANNNNPDPNINYANIDTFNENGGPLGSNVIVPVPAPVHTPGPQINGVAISAQTVVSASQSVAIPGQTGVSASENGTTVTITTPSAHGLLAGNMVTISGFTGTASGYNGTFMVTSVPTLTTFTYTSTAKSLPAATGGREVPVPVTPEPVTITTQSPHGLQAGDSVTISGFTGTASGYNGTFVVTSAPTPTTFTYTPATSLTLPAVPSATGVSEVPNFNLFALQPPQSFTQGPTPYVNSLTITVVDQHSTASTPSGALNVAADSNPGLYTLVGDQTGNVPISQVIVTNNPPVSGQQATATVVLIFAQPLRDDRYTLTINDNVVDQAGNQLDGGSNASYPLGQPTFPSGSNGLPANFVARFTVDSAPHIGVSGSGQQQLDINGNGIWDPVNALDAVNSDKAFSFGTSTDTLFSGNFAPAGQSGSGFDELGAYGQVNGQWRWLLTFNNVAQPDYSVVSTLQQNWQPVAGHFNPNINADEIALFDGNGNWYIDYNHTNNVGGPGTLVVSDGLQGTPVVGDFDGSGHIELATYQASRQLWTFDLNPFGVHNIVTLQWGFPNGVPVAADMNGDGVTDLGLYVPQTGSDDAGFQAAGWYWLVSQGTPSVGTVNTLAHAFNPTPFGSDLYFSFGNGNDLPLVGHWDPQLPTPTSTATPTPPPTATPTPPPTPGLITPPAQSTTGNSTVTAPLTPTPTPTKHKHSAVVKKHKLVHSPKHEVVHRLKHKLTAVHKTDAATHISRKPPTFPGRWAKNNAYTGPTYSRNLYLNGNLPSGKEKLTDVLNVSNDLITYDWIENVTRKKQ